MRGVKVGQPFLHLGIRLPASLINQRAWNRWSRILKLKINPE